MQISPSLVRQYLALYERYNTPAYQSRIGEIIRLVKARGFRPSQLEQPLENQPNDGAHQTPERAKKRKFS